MFNNIKSIKISNTDKVILKDYNTIYINSIKNNINSYFTLNKESRNLYYNKLNIKYNISKSLYSSDYNLWCELYNKHNTDFLDYYFILDMSNNLILNISDSDSVDCDINYNILNFSKSINSNIVTSKSNGYEHRIILDIDGDNNIYYVVELDCMNSKYEIYTFKYVNDIFIPALSNKPSYESENFYDFLSFDLNDDIELLNSIDMKELVNNYKNIPDDFELSAKDMLDIIKCSKLQVKLDSGDRFNGFVGIEDSTVFKNYFKYMCESYRTLKKLDLYEKSAIKHKISAKYLLETLTNYCISCDLTFKTSVICKLCDMLNI